MSFFTLVFRNLQMRPARTVLTIAGIAIGIAAVVALASVAWGFERTWVRVYTARGTDLIVTKAGSLSPVPASFPREQVRPLERLPGVVKSSGMLSDVVSIEDYPVVLLFGWEPDTFVWDHLHLVAGRWPSGEADKAVVLGTIARDLLHTSIGSEIRIETSTFVVCGVFESGSLAENGAIVMTLPQLQRVTDQPGRINFLNLKMAAGTAPDTIEATRGAITAALPGFRAFTAVQVADHNAAIQAVKAMSRATSALALIVGAVGVMNTVLMSVFERMQEIGILLAIGWRRRRIVAMILYESLALGLVGGLAGIALGSAAVKVLERTPWMRGKIAGEFSPSLFGLALLIALGLGVLGGLYPALRGARTNPGDALRHD
jgi:putative ABC transport system permease protein